MISMRCICETLTRGVLLVWLAFVATATCETYCQANEFQRSASFNQSWMQFDGQNLTVSTGTVTRQWHLSRRGLQTVSLRLGAQEYAPTRTHGATACDWDFGPLGECKLVSLSADLDDDERFTSDHLRVVAEFEYPEGGLRLRYAIWAYPGAPGLRTQCRLKALAAYDGAGATFDPQVVETISVQHPKLRRRAFGLMQGIKANMDARILREAEVPDGSAAVDWANGVALRADDHGVILIKESNKHTHLHKNADVATGEFLFDHESASVTGAGLLPQDVTADRFRNCWATWTVLFSGDESNAELALKRFDRVRFPVHPTHDVYIMANTWGTEDGRAPCLHAAREENVLEELESVADLGIDVLQIDDGWQTPQWTTAASAREVQHGAGAAKQFGDYPVYPHGWANVRRRADELGVKLGLWAAWTAPSAALIENYDRGDFKYFKLDFANLTTKDKFDSLTNKARTLVRYSNHTARVNWDVTEFATRMGYFSGREYGNVYLANRKTQTVRDPVRYVPYKVLNDAWNLSKYVNLNKFQVTVQNVDRLYPPESTDAGEHPHHYAVGIALMSSPIFFQETRHYSPTARSQVRELLSIYKQHRQAIYRGYVFPIGDEPDNQSWTGFQNHDPSSGSGYLTIFRERLNREESSDFNLEFVRNTNLRITNLVTAEPSTHWIGPRGELELKVAEAPGFLFLRYDALPRSTVSNHADPNRR